MMKEHQDKKVILIDTSGISWHDKSSLDELANLVTYLDYPREVHLCLNASANYRDLMNVTRAFKKTEYDRILIAKRDEAYSLGTVLSVAHEMDLSLSYMSTGQDVPYDIKPLSQEELARCLYEDFTRVM